MATTRALLSLTLTCLTLTPAAMAKDSGTCIPWDPQHTYETEHFTLHYDVDGADAVPEDDDGGAVTRTDGFIIGYAVAGDGVPDYVEEAAIGLEYARESYRIAGLRVPETQAVFIKDGLGAYGLYLPECHDIYLEPDLVGATRTAAHELAHAVQYQYWDLSDFAGIPGPEQAFYKEASADAMMIQVMRPTPYVSWFDDPDATYLLEAGTGAAFFWIYFGEQLGDLLPDLDVLPGLVGMARYLEAVAEPDLDLWDAMVLTSGGGESELNGLMEDLALANLLEDQLAEIEMPSDEATPPYQYFYSKVRGFYNAIDPLLLEAASFDLAGPAIHGQVRSLILDGVVSHRWNADYFEIGRSLYASGGWVNANLDASGEGVLFLVAVSVSADGIETLVTRRLEDGWQTVMALPNDPNVHLYIVAQNQTPGAHWNYHLEMTIARRR